MSTVIIRADMAISPPTLERGPKDAMSGNNSAHLDYEAELLPLVQSLESARSILHRAAASYSFLEAPARALGRVARAACRPWRLAILGESNSGKSSLANLLAGEATLPALPV